MADADIVVVEDADMPAGHDWLRLSYADGRIVIVYRESFATQSRFECREGLPFPA